MKLPYFRKAHVPKRKLTAYLLDPQHESARGKASYFIDRGFRAGDWSVFAEALREHAALHDVTETETDEYGTIYVIEGPLQIPGGTYTERSVRSVWMIPTAQDAPRFITAYPLS